MSLDPSGQTPILRSWDRRDRISAIGAVTVSPKWRRLRLYFHLMLDDENVHGEDIVAFLRQLRRHIPGLRTILWDRGNVHDRSKAVRACLAGHTEVVTEKFPDDAPKTNPDEMSWQQAKRGRLSNFTPDDTDVLRSVRVEELD
ncbi:transposase, partial [Aquisphaera insulae]|uniref:transposase n=1 Tax=Aquisphaera insulae TaxID=2712864 RepID=UPI00196AD38C